MWSYTDFVGKLECELEIVDLVTGTAKYVKMSDYACHHLDTRAALPSDIDTIPDIDIDTARTADILSLVSQ
jgi:hypothetical protein